ncbi:MAG: phosphotransferase [Acetobacteraceae bacterium]
MLDRQQILALIPQQGSMCLLDAMQWWTEMRIRCQTRSHLAADNPLRLGQRLAGVAGVEYGLQAMALHGALLQGGALIPVGLLVRLENARILLDRLDDPALGTLAVEAELEHRESFGMIYKFSISSGTGHLLVAGKGTIIQPAGTRFTAPGESEAGPNALGRALARDGEATA